MVLEFGLLKSPLFPESQALGDGLGADKKQAVVTDKITRLLGTFSGTTSAGGTDTITLPKHDGYKWLMVRGSLRNTSGTANPEWRVNGDTGLNYDNKAINNTSITKNSNQTGQKIAANTATGDVKHFWVMFDLKKTSGDAWVLQGMSFGENQGGTTHTFYTRWQDTGTSLTSFSIVAGTATVEVWNIEVWVSN